MALLVSPASSTTSAIYLDNSLVHFQQANGTTPRSALITPSSNSLDTDSRPSDAYRFMHTLDSKSHSTQTHDRAMRKQYFMHRSDSELKPLVELALSRILKRHGAFGDHATEFAIVRVS